MHLLFLDDLWTQMQPSPWKSQRGVSNYAPPVGHYYNNTGSLIRKHVFHNATE